MPLNLMRRPMSDEPVDWDAELAKKPWEPEEHAKSLDEDAEEDFDWDTEPDDDPECTGDASNEGAWEGESEDDFDWCGDDTDTEDDDLEEDDSDRDDWEENDSGGSVWDEPFLEESELNEEMRKALEIFRTYPDAVAWGVLPAGTGAGDGVTRTAAKGGSSQIRAEAGTTSKGTLSGK
ncbi:MAG: hypothetical protein LUI87_03135 [Lachnospiraceae bacterium]|nr:hypothetical protein [Lachnospiraceae bacterium]